VKEHYLLRSQVAEMCLRRSAQEYSRDSRGLRYLQTKFKRHRIFPLQQSIHNSIYNQNGTVDIKTSWLIELHKLKSKPTSISNAVNTEGKMCIILDT